MKSIRETSICLEGTTVGVSVCWRQRVIVTTSGHVTLPLQRGMHTSILAFFFSSRCQLMNLAKTSVSGKRLVLEKDYLWYAGKGNRHGGSREMTSVFRMDCIFGEQLLYLAWN